MEIKTTKEIVDKYWFTDGKNWKVDKNILWIRLDKEVLEVLNEEIKGIISDKKQNKKI